MKHLKTFFAFMLMAVLSIGQVWGAKDDVVYTLNTATTTIASSNSYGNYADDTNHWKITCGAKQSDGLWLGANNNQKAKMILSNGSYSEGTAIATALSIQASDTYYAAIIGTSALENVYKVSLTYTTPGGTAPSEAWILYSTDNGSTWSVGKKVTSLSTSGTNFEFDATIASARYAFVIHSTAYCQFKVPVLTFYEGTTSSGSSDPTVSAVPNNNAYGSVSVSGTMITASPNSGYQVIAGNGGYIVTSGTATVTNNGDNTFSVSATTDCSITINFEAIPTYTVTLKDDDSTLPQASAGASITLPSRDGCEGYTFAGWTKSWTSAQSTWTTTAPTIIDAGSYTPTANENLYPVYTKSEGQAEAWSLCSAANDVTEGTYVITWENSYYLPSETTASTNPAVGSGITQSNDKLTNTVSSAMQWTFTGDNTNGFAISHVSGNNTYRLASSNAAQGISVVNTTTQIVWKVSVDDTYGMLLRGSDGGTRNLAVYNSATWRYYATGNSYAGKLRLYKKTGGSTTSYISEPDCSAACEKKVTISAGTTPEHGSFELDKTGDQYTCDAAVDVIVTPTADENYHVGTVSATTGENGVDNHDGTWTITYAQETNTASTINVTFVEDTKYQVTWNVSGDETLKTNVYAGKKPVFPSNPSSCDATSTAFIGWATEPWSGKKAEPAATIYTKAADMPDVDAAVTYYAVFAEASGDASDLFRWGGGSSTALTALDNVTATGLGTDYAASNDPYLVKLDTDDDEIIITTSGEVGSVAINVKMIGGANTSYIYVQEAEDAEGAFSAVETLEISGVQNDEVELATSHVFKADSRAIKLLFKKGSNVGVGPISIVGAVHYSDYMTTCCTKYAVNIANGITNGSISADLAQACEGTTVTLTFTPTPNYHLSAWTLNGTEQDIAENTFTMPGQAVTVSATFEEDACDPLNTPSVTVSGKAYPYDAVKLTWTAIANADNYKVYIYDSEDNELEHNDAFAGVEYSIGQTLEAGTTYKYSVQAISNTPLVYCPSTEATSTFATYALPTAHLTLIDIEGELDESGDHTILTPFALPDEAASCAKAFVGWDPDVNCVKAPTYSKGAEFTFANTTDVTLYAVYATAAPGAATAVLSEDFSSITTGNSTATSGSGSAWTPNSNFSNSVTAIYQAGGAIRVGKSGSITTKSLDLSSGAVTVSFKLKGWSATENTVTVQVDNQTAQNATCTGYMSTGDFESKSLTFAAGTTTSVVKFTTSSSVRVFVDDIVISVPGASTYSAYSTTCGEAPTATPASASIDVAAAGASSTLSIAYKNVKLADVTVALFNNATCTEAFNGGWLTASVEGDDKHIAYTAQAAVSYTETRTAYIKLTAPENSGVEEPAVVVIPVTQAKKDAVFASLEELVAAQLPSGTPAVVSFSNVLITEIYATSAGYRYGLYLNVKDKDGENNIEIFYNKQQNAEQVPADWVKNGKVSATSLAGTWTYYNSTWELAMQADDWTWADNISYTAPKAVSSVVVSGTPNKMSYVDGETFDPAGLTVTVNYNDLTNEVISATDADWEFTPAKLAKGNTSVEVVATYNTVSSEAFEVTGLTVGDIQVKTIAQFIAAGGTRCYLEGTVSNLTNTTFGNFDLTDASGKIYVYGCLTPAGESKKFSELGVSVNDKIKVIAEQYTEHNTQGDEAINVVFVSKISPVQITIAGKTLEQGSNWTIEVETNPAAAVANISYEIKDDGSDAFVSLAGNVITANAVGTATIIASIPAGEGYLANSIEFEVEVVAAGSVANVVILAEYNGNYYALNNEAGTTTVEMNNGIVYVPDVATKNEIIWVRAEQNGVATFKNGEKYLKGGSSTTLSASEGASGSYEWNWVETGAKSYYTTDPNASTVRSFLYQNGQGIRNYAVSNIGNSSYAQAKVVEIPVSVKYVKDGDDPLVVDGSTIPDNTGVMLSDGVTLYIDEDKTLDNVIIEAGASVQIGSEQTLEVSGNLVLNATMGGGTSAQILGATNSNISLPAGADVFFDITLGAEGKRAEQWHAFTVPFPVDAINGVYDAATGEKLTNEVNYAIMDYHGDIRAQGLYGWKKYRQILQPGVFYLMTVDGERATYRFKKAAGQPIIATNSVTLKGDYTGAGDPGKDYGWNGVGNPNLFYGRVADYIVTVLNPTTYEYYSYNPEHETLPNFVVGTPFFIQYIGADTDFSMGAESGSGYYAPARATDDDELKTTLYIEQNGKRDWLYVTASAEAENNYQMGKDLVKMQMSSTPRVPRVSAQAYNNKLASIYTPLYGTQAEVQLNLYAPAEDTYTLSVPENDDVVVYLMRNGSLVWNLSMSAADIQLPQGESTEYSIRIVKAPKVATGIGNNPQDSDMNIQKVILDERVYILRNGHRYDVTGKLAK